MGGREISVLWGLEMMLYLVKVEFLKPEKAQNTAWAIHRSDKTITERVVYTFLYQLEEL